MKYADDSGIQHRISRYARWLFDTPTVSEAHVNAFVQLPYIGDSIDLSLLEIFVSSWDELLSIDESLRKKFGRSWDELLTILNDEPNIQQRVISKDKLKQAFEARYNKTSDKLFNLRHLKCLLSDDPDFFISSLDKGHFDRKASCLSTISPSSLKTVVREAIRHEECREIQLPADVSDDSVTQYFGNALHADLLQHGFRLEGTRYRR